MKDLKILTVVFNTEIEPYEVPAFRGAVAEKVGLEHEWYHNHNNDPNATVPLHYRYPLIQYKTKLEKTRTGNKLKPMLVFVDRIDEAQHFFMKQNWNMTFGGKSHNMQLSEMKTYEAQVGVEPQNMRSYQIKKWMALNEKNFNKYQALKTQEEKTSFLEGRLSAHIVSFCKGMQFRPQARFEVKIDKIQKTKNLPFEGLKVLTFELQFRSDFILPPYIGIGKGVSQGFGVVIPL